MKDIKDERDVNVACVQKKKKKKWVFFSSNRAWLSFNLEIKDHSWVFS